MRQRCSSPWCSLLEICQRLAQLLVPSALWLGAAGGASLCFLGCPAACTCLQSGCDKRCGGQVTRKGLSPGVRPSSSVWACGRRLCRSVWCRGHQDPHGCGLLLGVKAYSRCGHTYPGLSVVRVVTRLAEVDSWRTVTLTHVHGNMGSSTMLWT